MPTSTISWDRVLADTVIFKLTWQTKILIVLFEHFS